MLVLSLFCHQDIPKQVFVRVSNLNDYEIRFTDMYKMLLPRRLRTTFSMLPSRRIDPDCESDKGEEFV